MQHELRFQPQRAICRADERRVPASVRVHAARVKASVDLYDEQHRLVERGCEQSPRFEANAATMSTSRARLSLHGFG
jgi:hypothetical protein